MTQHNAWKMGCAVFVFFVATTASLAQTLTRLDSSDGSSGKNPYSQQPVNKCANNNWTEFHGANMERSNPCEGVLDVHNVGNLALKWRYDTGASEDSSPVEANGVLYIGSDLKEDKVYALEAQTGGLLWDYTTGNSVTSSPTVANGMVYIGSEDGYVYAFGLN